MLLAIVDGGGGGGTAEQERMTDFFIDLLERQNEVAEGDSEVDEKPSNKPDGTKGNESAIDPERPCAEILETLRNAIKAGNLQLVDKASKNYQTCLLRSRLKRADK